VDISDSMLIEDMEPLNRLEAAKLKFSQFVDSRPNDRIGVVIFAGEAFTLVPLTFDHVLVKERLASLTTAQQARIKDGTAIGVGMATGAMRLKDSEAKSRVMVFMTDGENNTGTIDPITGLELAKGYGIRIYTIGLGRDGPTQIPIMTRDAFGNQVKVYQPFESFVNDELLSRMARETGGVYYRATNGTELQNLLNDVDRLERTRVQATEFTQYEELFWWPLTVGLVLFLMSVILGWTYLLRLS
jgi:Ca-activated chloride channel family protein